MNLVDLEAALGENAVAVEFTKRDGSVRRMRCTRNAQFVTENIEAFTHRSEHGKAPNPDVMKVWDLDNNAWRSFRKDTVLRYEIV